MIRDDLASSHADLRVMQRANEFDATMTELWDEGIDCEVRGESYDEARALPSRGIVLIMKNKQIVTALPISQEVTIDDKRLEDYLDRGLADN